MLQSIAVIGAGLAGVRTAFALRAHRFDGRLVVYGEEAEWPYERPPLSKSVLEGKAAPEQAPLASAADCEAAGIELHLSRRVKCIERSTLAVRCTEGVEAFDRVVISTGARPNRLDVPGATLRGLHYLRSASDARALGAALALRPRVAVIGGGFIGLEVAASARKAGCDVVVIEAMSRLLARVLPESTAAFVEALHRDHGVEIMTNARVLRVLGGERCEGVELLDGRTIPADVVVVGIGVTPNDELAARCGLGLSGGIVVNECGRTADPRIFAVGDVAVASNPWLGRQVRLESWDNAERQAAATASALLGEHEAHPSVPWFWSDQHEMNLQLLGLPLDGDREIVRRDRTARRFCTFFMRGDRVVAALLVNSGGLRRTVTRLIESRARVPASLLADGSSDLKALVAACPRGAE